MANPCGLWASRLPGCPEWVWHASACCSSWFSCVRRDYTPCTTPGLGGLHLHLTEEGCQLFWAAPCLLSPPRPPRFARQCWRQLRSCGDELAGSCQRGRALQHPRCAWDVPGLAWSKQVVAKAPFFYRSSLLRAETLHKPQQPLPWCLPPPSGAWAAPCAQKARQGPQPLPCVRLLESAANSLPASHLQLAGNEELGGLQAKGHVDGTEDEDGQDDGEVAHQLPKLPCHRQGGFYQGWPGTIPKTAMVWGTICAPQKHGRASPSRAAGGRLPLWESSGCS